jgi:hypothetical protein
MKWAGLGPPGACMDLTHWPAGCPAHVRLSGWALVAQPKVQDQAHVRLSGWAREKCKLHSFLNGESVHVHKTLSRDILDFFFPK